MLLIFTHAHNIHARSYANLNKYHFSPILLGKNVTAILLFYDKKRSQNHKTKNKSKTNVFFSFSSLINFATIKFLFYWKMNIVDDFVKWENKWKWVLGQYILPVLVFFIILKRIQNHYSVLQVSDLSFVFIPFSSFQLVLKCDDMMIEAQKQALALIEFVKCTSR